MKEKLLNALGTFGGILFYIITLAIAILPILVIDVKMWMIVIIILACYIFPPLSIPVWIWGLIVALKGPQDVLAIIYYIAFVIVFLPFIITTISSLFNKSK